MGTCYRCRNYRYISASTKVGLKGFYSFFSETIGEVRLKLGARQEAFSRLIPKLYAKAFELGFEIRTGSAFRDPRLHGHKGYPDLMTWLDLEYPEIAKLAIESGYRAYGSRVSLHKDKCAIDLNLRDPDKGMVYSTEGHRELGEWWEQQHPMCRWGGRFNDGNHYEFLEWR